MESTPGDDLRSTLRRIDGRGYKAYKDIRGRYAQDDVLLCIDHVQGDPFGAPSKLRLRVDRSRAGFEDDLFAGRTRRTALRDYLARRAADAAEDAMQRGGRRGSGKSGVIRVDAGGQEVLERTAVVLGSDWLELRVQVGLPAAGRRILGREAERLLLDCLPDIARRSLRLEELSESHLYDFVECVENQEQLRAGLEARGLVAFVADGSVLPRESGASDEPLASRDVVPFEAPEGLRTTLPLRYPTRDGKRELQGMGIPKGVTLVVGGGYHGKSTLLAALERAVHPHIPGDGREGVVTDPRAVKIRAEDGRRVENVDIGGFISELPGGRATASFSSDDASGSTSQAANIVEALECGARVLLLDEDTSATNFMIRDARMQSLVHDRDEPITPFVDRVRALYEDHGVSSVLVMGGSGDYFDVADTVVRMREYRPEDASEEAKRIAREQPSERRAAAASPLAAGVPRIPLAQSFDPSRGRREVKIEARALDQIRYGRDDIDLRGVEQLLDESQTRAIGNAIHLMTRRFMDGERNLGACLDALEALLDDEGLDVLDPFQRREEHPGNLARPRRFEVAAAINRLRTLRMRQHAAD